jgi:hypothetical protein
MICRSATHVERMFGPANFLKVFRAPNVKMQEYGAARGAKVKARNTNAQNVATKDAKLST